MTRAIGFNLQNFQSNLLSWYARHKRALPWRDNPALYRVWISEVMLQQTTVTAILPRFERFLLEFPDIQSLAKAKEDRVLAAWAGLGYYSRAKNLRLAAQEIVKKYGGRFPEDFDEILSLPGIGRYTAGAILSIAFQKPYPVLDGNVARFFSRIFAKNGDAPKFWALAEELLSHENPGDWNQALMELGETVCVPENPNCLQCPVKDFCQAFKKEAQNRFPAPKRNRPFVDMAWTVLWIEKNARILIWKRSEKERLLKSHWGLPESQCLKVNRGKLIKTAQHTITHHKISVDVRAAVAPERLPKEARWVSKKELSRFLISSLWKKCLPH